MRVREHQRIERDRRRARRGFRFNTDLNRWEYCHGNSVGKELMWRPLNTSGSLMSAQSKDPQLARYFVSYDATWAEDIEL